MSQKAQRGVRLVDLAANIDERRAAVLKACRNELNWRALSL
jgi:hypothetical protein